MDSYEYTKQTVKKQRVVMIMEGAVILALIGVALDFGIGNKRKNEELLEKDNTINVITNDKNELVSQVASLNLQIEEKNQQITTLNSSIQTLTSQKDALDSQIATLTSQKDNLQTQVDSLTNDNAAKDTQISNLNTQKTNLESQITTLNNEKTSLESQVTTLNNEKTANESTIASLNTQISNLNTQIVTLEGEKSTLNANIVTLTNDNESKATTISELNTAKTNLESQITTLTTEKNNLQSQIDSLTITKTENESTISTLTTQKNNLETQITTLTTEKNNLQSQIDSLTTTKIDNEATIASLTTEKNNLQTQVNDLTTEKNNLQSQVDTLNGEKTANLATIASLETDKTNLNSTISGLQTEKSNLETQISNLQTEKTNLQSQVDTLTNDKNALQTQLTNMTALAETYTVFYVYGDQVKGTVSVSKGNSVTTGIPDAPIKSGYISKWEDADNVTSDKVVFAEFVDSTITLTGDAKVGSTLTVTPNADLAALTLTYTWTENVSGGGTNNIANTANTYDVVAANKNNTITCTVTAEGYTGSNSVTSGAIIAGLTGSVSISETTSGVFTATYSDASSYTQGVDYKFVWYSDDQVIFAQEGSTFTTVEMAHLGCAISAKVVGINSYDGYSLTSNTIKYLHELTGSDVNSAIYEGFDNSYTVIMDPTWGCVTYAWYVDDVLQTGETSYVFYWSGLNTVKCVISGDDIYTKGSITITEFYEGLL